MVQVGRLGGVHQDRGRHVGGQVQALAQWGRNNPPKAWAEMKQAILFKDDPNSILPFPAAAAPATPMDPKLTTPAGPKGVPLTDPKADPKKSPPAGKGGLAPKKPGG